MKARDSDRLKKDADSGVNIDIIVTEVGIVGVRGIGRERMY
jgi:hypothetical protein